MKHLLFLFSLLGGLLFSQSEKISSFHTKIEVQKSGDLRVTETISIYATGDIFKRGLVRKLPLKRKDKNNFNVRVDYTLNTVLKDSLESNYFTKEEDGDWAIYIGDSDVFLEEGEYTYQITYTTEGQIGFFDDYDEVYWNVNGFYWDVDIDSVSAEVHLPDAVEPKQTACYTGVYGSTESNCTSNIIDNITYFKAGEMFSGENLTVGVGFSKGYVKEPPPPTFWEKYSFFIISIIGILGLMIYYVITWRKHGVDPEKPTVYPQFNAPEDLSPASVGILHKEKYWNDLITASMVNLGIKGYLKIEEKKDHGFLGFFKSKEFTLTKIKESTPDLPDEERVILEELFSKTDEITINGTYNADVEDMVNGFKGSVNDQYGELIDKGNNTKFIWTPLLVMIGILAYGIYHSNGFEGLTVLFFAVIAALGNVPIFLLLFVFFRATGINLKYLKYLLIIPILLVIVIIVFDLIKGGWHAYSIDRITLFGFLIFGIPTFFLYKYLIKRPDGEKLRIQSLIDGLKMYLGTAEEKQIQHFNPPEMTPKVFEKMLPYAIVLGTEDVWGKKFQTLINRTAVEPYQSTWYSGTPMVYGNFGHTLNSSLSNTINRSTVKPPSSSGSSSGGGSWGGGSGGGGFSGGGGGGGGGGGW